MEVEDRLVLTSQIRAAQASTGSQAASVGAEWDGKGRQILAWKPLLPRGAGPLCFAVSVCLYKMVMETTSLCGYD